MSTRYGIGDYVHAGAFFTLYGLVKYLPPPVGDVLRFCVLKCFLGSIRSWRIKDGATFWFPRGIRIGRHVTINEGVFLDGYGGLEIGDNCRIAHGCSFISEDHVFTDPSVPIRMQGKVAARIVIGADVWLGTGAKVLKGVTIGDGCVIGAGAVVTRDLAPFSIAVGIPARVVGRRDGIPPEERRAMESHAVR